MNHFEQQLEILGYLGHSQTDVYFMMFNGTRYHATWAPIEEANKLPLPIRYSVKCIPIFEMQDQYTIRKFDELHAKIYCAVVKYSTSRDGLL